MSSSCDTLGKACVVVSSVWRRIWTNLHLSEVESTTENLQLRPAAPRVMFRHPRLCLALLGWTRGECRLANGENVDKQGLSSGP